MMIDWGQTPVGSVVSIYWPQVSAASVVKLAQQLYPAQALACGSHPIFSHLRLTEVSALLSLLVVLNYQQHSGSPECCKCDHKPFLAFDY